MKSLIARFMKDESGATAIEYGLIAALISVAIIGGATVIGGELEETFGGIGDSLAGADRAPAAGGGIGGVGTE